jgi:hypothetical protein
VDAPDGLDAPAIEAELEAARPIRFLLLEVP